MYEGKFYNAREKKTPSIWEKDRQVGEKKEKKSHWSNIKTTFFTPIGTKPDTRAHGERRLSKQTSENPSYPQHDSSLDSNNKND